MKGRKPKPQALKLIDGDYVRTCEPHPTAGRPSCPDFLTDEARYEWERIVPELDRIGLLTQLDRAFLAAYCQAWGRWVKAENTIKQKGTDGLTFRTPNGALMTSPWLWIVNKALDQIHRFGTEFGFSPASRSRINMKNLPEEENDLF